MAEKANTTSLSIVNFSFLFIFSWSTCILHTFAYEANTLLEHYPLFLLMTWLNPCKFSLENDLSSTSISLLRFSKMSLVIMLSVQLLFEGDIPNTTDTSDSLCGKGCQYITMAMASSVDTFKESTL